MESKMSPRSRDSCTFYQLENSPFVIGLISTTEKSVSANYKISLNQEEAPTFFFALQSYTQLFP